jgi:hypothetical protein
MRAVGELGVVVLAVEEELAGEAVVAVGRATERPVPLVPPVLPVGGEQLGAQPLREQLERVVEPAVVAVGEDVHRATSHSTRERSVSAGRARIAEVVAPLAADRVDAEQGDRHLALVVAQSAREAEVVDESAEHPLHGRRIARARRELVPLEQVGPYGKTSIHEGPIETTGTPVIIASMRPRV